MGPTWPAMCEKMDTNTARIVKPTEIKDCLDVAIKAVRRRQAFLHETQEEIPKIASKEAREVEIDLDFALEKLILDELREHPSWQTLSEESGTEKKLEIHFGLWTLWRGA